LTTAQLITVLSRARRNRNRRAAQLELDVFHTSTAITIVFTAANV